MTVSEASFAHRMVVARTAKGLTQSQLARASEIGSDMTISRYERGEFLPRSDIAVKLAAALDVGVEWLLTGEGRGPRAHATTEPSRD